MKIDLFKIDFRDPQELTEIHTLYGCLPCTNEIAKQDGYPYREYGNFEGYRLVFQDITYANKVGILEDLMFSRIVPLRFETVTKDRSTVLTWEDNGGWNRKET